MKFEQDESRDADLEFFDKSNINYERCPECKHELKVFNDKLVCIGCKLTINPKK